MSELKFKSVRHSHKEFLAKTATHKGFFPCGLPRVRHTGESRYPEALRPNAKPRYDTIAKVCAALGVRLVAQAIHA